ncbi:hypothetical protein CC80DRAFT_538939 [Byssothecium circinans]|uniref:Galactose oxidase n=1 Tax=Byssothecium circinans TaxID=147558 RepID=A0A6A5TKT7_9PLEO|nr:hypothetical protein CC80DRAFT_538939 [Byssothecium circinans]
MKTSPSRSGPFHHRSTGGQLAMAMASARFERLRERLRWQDCELSLCAKMKGVTTWPTTTMAAADGETICARSRGMDGAQCRVHERYPPPARELLLSAQPDEWRDVDCTTRTAEQSSGGSGGGDEGAPFVCCEVAPKSGYGSEWWWFGRRLLFVPEYYVEAIPALSGRQSRQASRTGKRCHSDRRDGQPILIRLSRTGRTGEERRASSQQATPIKEKTRVPLTAWPFRLYASPFLRRPLGSRSRDKRAWAWAWALAFALVLVLVLRCTALRCSVCVSPPTLARPRAPEQPHPPRPSIARRFSLPPHPSAHRCAVLLLHSFTNIHTSLKECARRSLQTIRYVLFQTRSQPASVPELSSIHSFTLHPHSFAPSPVEPTRRSLPTMGLPTPKYPLSGHCSIVVGDTLYAYSPAGFQSLQLGKGGEWKALPMDISLTGAQCVKAGSGDDARLYVVGGTPNATAANWDYPGLMYYSLKEKKWDWIRSESFPMQKRVNHGAVYLEEDKSIFVFSGSQTGYTGPSLEAFRMKIEKPYQALAINTGPVPLVKPQLKQWDANRALVVGGTDNTLMWTFHPTEGFVKLGTSLAAPIANPDMTQSTLVTGTDGSKVLELFDMSVTPTRVTRIAILKAGGEVAAPGTTVGDKKTKRLTMADWPAYNGTYAPTVTRTGSSIAQADDDTVVISGGNTEDPLCIFDQQLNSWKNASELFSGKQQANILLSTSSSASGSATATANSSPSASSSAAAGAGVPKGASVNDKDRMLTVLGATLGAIFGIAAILILLLFCLKWRKNKNKNQQSSYQEKDRLSFADRGDAYMSEAGMHKFQEANMSQTSLAIIGSGRPGGHKKGMLSDASTSGLIKKSSPLGYSEPVELSKFNLKPEPKPETLVRQNSSRAPATTTANLQRSRSSGWSRYFANNEATNLAQMPSDRSTFASERTSTGSQSMYTNSRYQPSQAIPPLTIPKLSDGQRLSKVARGSPTLGNSAETLPGVAMQAQLSRADSNGSTHSGYSRDDNYLRDGVDSWSPVNNDGRPASSAYTGSVVIDDFRQAAGGDSYYVDGTSSYYPKSNYSSFHPGGKLGDNEVRESTATTFPGMATLANPGGSSQPPPSKFSDFYPAPPKIGGEPAVGRESTVTVFPGLHPGAEPKGKQQDMSWLNLGTSSGK